MLLTRTNSITHVPYAQDPTIMSWELANEPRGAGHLRAFNRWIRNMGKQIKSLAPHQLLTTGVEGDFHASDSGLDLIENHKSKYIDYATLHVWAQNAGIYDPEDAETTFPIATKWASDLVDRHLALQRRLQKPLVLEEFGLARDENLYEPKDPVTYRDTYYKMLFDKVLSAATQDRSLSGVNFWAWGGEGVPVPTADGMWKPGDVFVGDPAHEHQGWYSVYSTDQTTLQVIAHSAAQLNALK